jgi:hypothetical protein
MTATPATIHLIRIAGRDNWTERYLNNLETIACGPIVACREDGRGGMTFWLRPRTRKLKAERKAIDKAFHAIGLASTWVERI